MDSGFVEIALDITGYTLPHDTYPIPDGHEGGQYVYEVNGSIFLFYRDINNYIRCVYSNDFFDSNQNEAQVSSLELDAAGKSWAVTQYENFFIIAYVFDDAGTPKTKIEKRDITDLTTIIDSTTLSYYGKISLSSLDGEVFCLATTDGGNTLKVHVFDAISWDSTFTCPFSFSNNINQTSIAFDGEKIYIGCVQGGSPNKSHYMEIDFSGNFTDIAGNTATESNTEFASDKTSIQIFENDEIFVISGKSSDVTDNDVLKVKEGRQFREIDITAGAEGLRGFLFEGDKGYPFRLEANSDGGSPPSFFPMYSQMIDGEEFLREHISMPGTSILTSTVKGLWDSKRDRILYVQWELGGGNPNFYWTDRAPSTGVTIKINGKDISNEVKSYELERALNKISKLTLSVQNQPLIREGDLLSFTLGNLEWKGIVKEIDGDTIEAYDYLCIIKDAEGLLKEEKEIYWQKDAAFLIKEIVEKIDLDDMIDTSNVHPCGVMFEGETNFKNPWDFIIDIVKAITVQKSTFTRLYVWMDSNQLRVEFPEDNHYSIDKSNFFNINNENLDIINTIAYDYEKEGKGELTSLDKRKSLNRRVSRHINLDHLDSSEAQGVAYTILKHYIKRRTDRVSCQTHTNFFLNQNLNIDSYKLHVQKIKITPTLTTLKMGKQINLFNYFD